MDCAIHAIMRFQCSWTFMSRSKLKKCETKWSHCFILISNAIGLYNHIMIISCLCFLWHFCCTLLSYERLTCSWELLFAGQVHCMGGFVVILKFNSCAIFCVFLWNRLRSIRPINTFLRQREHCTKFPSIDNFWWFWSVINWDLCHSRSDASLIPVGKQLSCRASMWKWSYRI